MKELIKQENERGFWRVVNDNRKKRAKIDESIKDEEWMMHFMKELEQMEWKKLRRKAIKRDMKEEKIYRYMKLGKQ